MILKKYIELIFIFYLKALQTRKNINKTETHMDETIHREEVMRLNT